MDDIVYDSVVHIILLSRCLVVYAYMCAILLIIGSLRYSWKRLRSSWLSVGHYHVPILRILGSGAWQQETLLVIVAFDLTDG